MKRRDHDQPEPELKQVSDEQLKRWRDEMRRLLGYDALQAQQHLTFFARNNRPLFELRQAAATMLIKLGAKDDAKRETVLAVQGLAEEIKAAADEESNLRRQATNARQAEEQAKQDTERERLQHERPDLHRPGTRRRAPTMTE